MYVYMYMYKDTLPALFSCLPFFSFSSGAQRGHVRRPPVSHSMWPVGRSAAREDPPEQVPNYVSGRMAHPKS